MTRGTATRGKKLSSKKAWLFIGVVLLVAAVGLPALMRVILAPWSIGLGGRDTLNRTWAGPMQAKLGAQYGMYLDLQYKDFTSRRRTGRARGGSRRSNLQGRAAICTRTGEVWEYQLSGRADRSGKITSVWMEYGDPKLSALNINIKGPWKADRLTITTSKNPFLPDGRFEANRSLSSADPDDSFAPVALQPGNRAAFDAICARVRGSGV